MNLKPETIAIHFPDGSSNAINVFRSHTDHVQTVIVIFPALGIKGSYYRHCASEMSKQGIHVVTIDHRGHGHSSERASQRNSIFFLCKQPQ